MIHPHDPDVPPIDWATSEEKTVILAAVAELYLNAVLDQDEYVERWAWGAMLGITLEREADREAAELLA